MGSWVRSITSPFRKSCIFFNNNDNNNNSKDKINSQPGHGHDNRVMDLQGEVMACGYKDVQVMWSILDKSNPGECKVGS